MVISEHERAGRREALEDARELAGLLRQEVSHGVNLAKVLAGFSEPAREVVRSLVTAAAAARKGDQAARETEPYFR